MKQVLFQLEWPFQVFARRSKELDSQVLLAEINFPPISDVLNWKAIAFNGSPFALNKVGLITLVSAGFTLLLFYIAGRQRQLVPSGIQNFVESVVDFINNSIVFDVMGAEGAPWAPYLTGLFFFILFSKKSDRQGKGPDDKVGENFKWNQDQKQRPRNS